MTGGSVTQLAAIGALTRLHDPWTIKHLL